MSNPPGAETEAPLTAKFTDITKPTKRCPDHARCNFNELSLLYHVSVTLQSDRELSEILDPILQHIAVHMGMERGTLSIFNRNRSELSIEAAYGLTKEEKARGVYKIGEGITGRVAETGKPELIPSIHDEPSFLNRTRARENVSKHDIAYICVPIKYDKEVIGVLSVDKVFDVSVPCEEDIRLLSIIAAMVAHRVRSRQSVREKIEALEEENKRLQWELHDKFKPDNIIGDSKEMKETYRLIGKVAASNATVLIRGESGVGKEVVANAIHFHSDRKDHPFIKVNCSAFPESLLESELFGHEKGAFTGADQRRKGRFELAEGGTLFLDEMGDISLSAQVKLLRVLQEREFERVGGSETLKANVRIIAATNRNLEDLIVTGNFREDLFYRINVFPIYVPPLRERKSDILQLANYFVDKFNKINGLEIKRISSPAIDMLMSYHWPGNVRELENCIERAGLLAQEGVISGYNLPATLQPPEDYQENIHELPLLERLERIEKELILDALKGCKGNMARASRKLGVSERVMGLRIKKFDVDLKAFKKSRT